MPRPSNRQAWRSRLPALLLPALLAGCATQALPVQVVLFNHTTVPLGEVSIQGQYIGGYYARGADGTGGKVHCCIRVVPGPAMVAWTYGGEEGSADAGRSASASGLIPRPAGQVRYLGVHVHPDERVAFSLGADMPD